MRRRLARRTPILLTLLLSHAVAPTWAVAQVEPAPAAPREEQPAEAVTLSLSDALKAALENNLDIAVRRYDPAKSEALVTVQQSVFDPLLTGSSSSSDRDERGNSFFVDPNTNQVNAIPFTSSSKTHEYAIGFEDPLIMGGRYRINVGATDNRRSFETPAATSSSLNFTTTWNLTYTQPLLRSMGPDANRWAIVVARNNLGISESQFRQTILDTLSAAEKAYWDLNFALMDLKTKRASLQLAKDFLEQNRIKVRVGTLAPIEITQAEAGVADREEGVILAENAVRTAEDALRRIMNVPRESPMWSQPIQPSDAPQLVEVSPQMEAAVAEAEAHRPDLEQARLDLRSKETELYYRRNQRRWGLDLEGEYGWLGFSGGEEFLAPVVGFNYGNSFDDLRDRNQPNWRLLLTLSVPIGNRLAVANFINAENALNQSRFSLQNLEQAARIEVRNAVRTVETNLKRVKAAQVNVRLQREKLAAEQKKFENGMSTSFQVLQFQTDLATAESRENQAIVDYNKSLVELERAKGTLLEARNLVLPGKAPGPGGPAERPMGREPSEATGDRVTLPEEFVFDGRRLLGLGGGREGAAR